MTKDEYLEAKEKSAKYQSLEYELNKVDDALKNIKHYSSFTFNTNYTCGNATFSIDSQIREELTTLLQNYRDWISDQMEEL